MKRDINTICHTGEVVEVGSEKIIVRILAQSACSACQAKGACNMSEMQEKIIEVPASGKQSYQPGEQVNIIMNQNTGLRAVFFGYILPFIILVTSIFVFAAITGSEGQAGLIAIVLLIPYYIVLYLFRDKLRNSFQFNIES